MKLYLEGTVHKIVSDTVGGRKEGSKKWNVVNYQILSDFPGKLSELETLNEMEADPAWPTINPLLEAASRSKAPVKILLAVNADRRDGRQGEINTRILDVVLIEDNAPSKGANGRGVSETVKAGA